MLRRSRSKSEKIYEARVHREAAAQRQQDKAFNARAQSARAARSRQLIAEIQALKPRCMAVLDSREWQGAARQMDNKYFMGFGPTVRKYSPPQVTVYEWTTDHGNDRPNTFGSIGLAVNGRFYVKTKAFNLSYAGAETLEGIVAGMKQIIAGNVK